MVSSHMVSHNGRQPTPHLGRLMTERLARSIFLFTSHIGLSVVVVSGEHCLASDVTRHELQTMTDRGAKCSL